MEVLSFTVFSCLLILPLAVFTQSPDPPADVASVDAIINALYEGISFKPGGISDWNQLRTLFSPGARLIPPAAPNSIVVLSFEEFAERSTQYADEHRFRANGFSKREVA